MAGDLMNSFNEIHHQPYQSPSLAVLALLDLDGLSYEDYFKKIDEMVNSLRQHWKAEQRVKALKVSIQLTKLLADSSQMKLYSKKYKMITDILDEFGRSIYLRIQARARGDNNQQQQQPPEQHGDDTNLDRAKDTCRNWFLKIASIRELVPRFYNELAILKVCDILLQNKSLMRNNFSLNEEQFYLQSLKRLSKAAWGFGDPIVAIHARAYLCKVATKLISWTGEIQTNDTVNDHDSEENREQAGVKCLFDIIMLNLEACSIVVSKLDSSTLNKLLRSSNPQNSDPMTLFELLTNPLQSIVNLVSLRQDVYDEDESVSLEMKEKLESIFRCSIKRIALDQSSPLLTSEQKCLDYSKNVILNSLLRSLPGDTVAEHAEEIMQIIQQIHQNWSLRYGNAPAASGARGTHVGYSKMIVSTSYCAISSFALALDSSDQFELLTDNQQLKESLFNSINSILEALFCYETSLDDDDDDGDADDENLSGSRISSNYLRSFKAWFSYANHYLDYENNLDSILLAFIKRINKDRQYIQQYPVILDLIKILITNRRTLSELRRVLQMKSFNQLLSLVSRDEHRLEVSRWILETARANLKLNKQEPLNIQDRGIIGFIIKLATIINDSLNLLTSDDDLEHLSELIIYFLQEIQFQDCKEHLEFYSRCRGSLGNLNLILKHLSKEVLKLATKYLHEQKRRNLKRNFLNGCLAFTLITIPALSNPLIRLQLFIEGAQLALGEMSLTLADYYLKQALVSLDKQIQNYRVRSASSMSTSSANNGESLLVEETIRSNKINKPLMDQVHLLLNLILKHEDHVDLKHKLALTNLIDHSSLGEHQALMDLVSNLNTIDFSNAVDNNNET